MINCVLETVKIMAASKTDSYFIKFIYRKRVNTKLKQEINNLLQNTSKSCNHCKSLK